MNDLRIVTVGGPWLDEGTLPLPEGPHFNLTELPQLAIVVNNATEAEARAIREGEFEFAVTVIEPVIFFLYRCEPVFGWSDAPFNIHRMDEASRKYWMERNYKPGDHPILHLLLVDAQTNIILAMRAFTIPPSLSVPLFDAIHKQGMSPYTEQLYNSILNGVYQRQSSSELVAQAIGKGIGGT